MSSQSPVVNQLYPAVDLENAHVLIIEDQASIREHIHKALRNSGRFARFTEAKDGLEGFQKLLQNHENVDVIVCDVEMPQLDGFKFLSLKSSKPELAEIPVVMLTSRTEPEHRLRGLEMGASDYVAKPFDDGELVARATNQLKIIRLLKTLRAQTVALEKLSNTDALTKLYNRRYLISQLEREFSRSERHDKEISLLLCDIDHFKNINDRYGHQVGDSVLIEVARVIGMQAREHDIVARYGGEEFCVVLPETGIEDAFTVAERCRKAIESREFPVGDNKIDVRLSIGVAARQNSRVVSADDLLRRADIALYSAKAEGRNRSIRYSPSDNTDF